jgi:hypothetical protein
MAYILLGTSSQLQIKVPTIGSTDWADVMRTDTFLKIAQHQHTGSGDGSQLGTGSILADAVTGAKIRLDNNEFLKARNQLNTANINMLKVNTSDDIEFEAEIAVAILKQNTYLLGKNQADSGEIDLIKVDASDNIALGADLANLSIINNTYITSVDNAGTGSVNIAKVNAADKIELGANVLAANVETISTSLIDTLTSAITLADNQSAVTAGVVSLGTDESCTVHYRIVRNGVTQSGTLQFTDVDTIPSESFQGSDVGVTFTVNAGDLEYATTSTGNTASLTFVVIKE